MRLPRVVVFNLDVIIASDVIIESLDYIAVEIVQKTDVMGKDKDTNVKDDHNRDEAYTLGAPEQHVAYYDAWAETYDDDFLKAEGYAAPYHVAKRLHQIITENDNPSTDITPVADIGCGTGAVGNSLAQLGANPGAPITLDGFDISTGMLGVAAKTGHYRGLHQADFTKAQPLHENSYGAIVSSGTFTLGHLGPDDLWRALSLGRHDALGLISINAAHFEENGFMRAFQDWQSRGMITPPVFHDIGLYFNSDAATTTNTDGILAEFRVIKP